MHPGLQLFKADAGPTFLAVMLGLSPSLRPGPDFHHAARASHGPVYFKSRLPVAGLLPLSEPRSRRLVRVTSVVWVSNLRQLVLSDVTVTVGVRVPDGDGLS